MIGPNDQKDLRDAEDRTLQEIVDCCDCIEDCKTADEHMDKLLQAEYDNADFKNKNEKENY